MDGTASQNACKEDNNLMKVDLSMGWRTDSAGPMTG
jgi:hypothetical protein